jgi:hypothetical protein
MNLFSRAPETLDGYVPKFSWEEIIFGCKIKSVQIGGHFKDMDFDPNNIQYEDVATIRILDYTASGTAMAFDRPIDSAVRLVNEFLANPNSKRDYPEAFAYVQTNAVEMNNSKRYWLAKEHEKQIADAEAEIIRRQEEVRRAKWIHSMYATEVKSDRALTHEEKKLLLAEFSGGEYEEL